MEHERLLKEMQELQVRVDKEAALARALESSQQRMKSFLIEKLRTTRVEAVTELLESISFYFKVHEDAWVFMDEGFEACLGQLKKAELLD